ncbi:MAG TPA: DinB family protein [Ignavibacteriaceae bacterium]|nr:DinB family protein [Ignavibacteriaceae bacterium]
MIKNYRKGAIGALMDEYERAAEEFKDLVSKITSNDFEKIVDLKTKDDDCRSVQTIISHVINSGYGYANYIRDWFAIPKSSPERRLISQNDFSIELDKMLAYTAETLEGKWEYSNEEIMKVKMIVRWGPQYDLEQLLEHAIVHILRHRRQIEKFARAEKISISHN